MNSKHGLSTYNPLWDRCRTDQGPGRTFEDKSLLLATDFEGGNGTNIRCIGEDRYAVDLEPEPGENIHGYDNIAYYVCFGVRNRSNTERTIRVHMKADCRGKEDWSTQEHMVVRREGRWSQLPRKSIRRIRGETDALEVTLTLPPAHNPDPALFVSNFHWWPGTEVMRYIAERADAEAVRVVTIGSSYEGRALPAVEIGDAGGQSPCLVLAATPQPSEMGHLMCASIIDFLLSDRDAAKRIRDRFLVCLLPLTNPDGNARGYGLVDAQSRFQYFEADLAAGGDENASPETAAVWRYLQEKTPVLFWEWHSNNWSRRPGNMLLRYRPEIVNDPDVVRKWTAIDQQLMALPTSYHGSWTSHTEGPYQPSMGFQAATRIGCIAHMIKVHDKYPLEQTQAYAVSCLRAATDVLTA